MSKSKIHIKPENRGKFNATKKRTGKTTEELTHSKNPKTRKRAIFAQNARKWKHAEGGFLDFRDYADSYALPMAEGGKLTKFDKDQEKTFQSWYGRTSKALGLNSNPDDPNQKYDYRGFYKEYGDVPMESGQHFTDTYKLPGHETFSNESKYSNFNNRDITGHWGRLPFEIGTGYDNWIAPGKSQLPIKSEGGYFRVDDSVHESMHDYGMGSWLEQGVSGAASGAAAGSVIPGWGTTVGAIIGGVTGIAKGIIGDKKAKQEEAAQRKEELQVIGANRASGYSNQSYLPTFADGGDLKPDQVYQKREQYINQINKPLPKGKAYFTLKDLQNGKPGIRHGTKIDKGILNAIATAAAKEKVPLLDALATGMRETGLGYHSEARTPKDIMQSPSSDYIPGIPQDYDQWRMKNNLVDKKYVSKDKSGYLIDMTEPDESKLKHLGAYNKYLDTFKYDPTLKEPFRKEMRFLKGNLGKAYNPGEKDRIAKLAREKKVIMANPDMFHYADSVYNVNSKKFNWGGDFDAASDLKGYGYNLMAEGGQLLDQLSKQHEPNPGGGLGKELLMRGDGVDIYKVNGNFVRHEINPDFVVGGHHYVGKDYKAIPKNEIWIDDAYANKPEDPSERTAMEAAIMHEINERKEMKTKGKSYNKAHKDSNVIEQKFEGAQGYEVGGMLPSVGNGLPNGATMPRYMAAGGHMPEGNSTLKEAKEFIKMYPKEMAYGTKTEYEHTGNKKLAQRIAADHIKDSIKMNKGGEPDYYKKLQDAGISDELNKLPVMAKGGKLSPEKAKEMLRDGTVHGKPLTPRQKRYFGFIAGGGTPKKAVGGPLDKHDTPVARYEDILNSLDNRNYADGGNVTNYVSQRPVKDIERDLNKSLANVGTIISNYTGDVQKRMLDANYRKIQEHQRELKEKPLLGKNPVDIDAKSYNVGGYFGTAYSVSGGINEGSTFNKKSTTEYNGGGTHEQNSLGGIPVGSKARVESGEVRFDDPDTGESYIFSNRF